MKTLLVLAAALAAATPALAQAPIAVEARVHNETAPQGGFQIAACKVDNLSGEDVLLLFDLFVTYADGSVQSFRLNQPPTALGPGESFILEVFFAVPGDAGLGTATFTCSVRAVGPGGMGHLETATATFEVTEA